MIRRELTLAEGDAYNQSKIDQSTKNLKNLGYFKNENITTSPGSTPQQVVLEHARSPSRRPASSRSAAAIPPSSARCSMPA